MRQDQENMEMSLWNGREQVIQQQKERLKDVQEKYVLALNVASFLIVLNNDVQSELGS